MAVFEHNSPQVCTYAPGMTDPRWLGAIGNMSGLNYSSTLPGGCAAMAMNLLCPPELRTPATNPGRIVRVYRGGSVVWRGIMQEPAPSTSGYSLTAIGNGSEGDNYMAVYSTYDQNNAVNQAITRGLSWINPGQSATGLYFAATPPDSGSQSITDYLNGLCTYGAYTWKVDTWGNLTIFPLPAATTPTRYLVATTPVARTIAGDVNGVWLRYQSAADNDTTGTPAVFSLTEAVNAASQAVHQPLEQYADLSAATEIATSGEALTIGDNLLSQYVRANFAGPFTVQQGQLLNAGGVPVDLATESAGQICQLLISDFGYGGEVVPGPICFIVGQYAYDDDSETATVTPFQSIATSFSSLVQNAVTANTPPSSSSS